MGVEVIVRALPLGDFLWIARERTVVQPGQLCPPPARELVLDYVVERKRMDDLVRGRKKEEKQEENKGKTTIGGQRRRRRKWTS